MVDGCVAVYGGDAEEVSAWVVDREEDGECVLPWVVSGNSWEKKRLTSWPDGVSECSGKVEERGGPVSQSSQMGMRAFSDISNYVARGKETFILLISTADARRLEHNHKTRRTRV